MLLRFPLYGLEASLEKVANTTPVTGTKPISASSGKQVPPSTGQTNPPLGKLNACSPEVATRPPYKVPEGMISLPQG